MTPSTYATILTQQAFLHSGVFLNLEESSMWGSDSSPMGGHPEALRMLSPAPPLEGQLFLTF